jgi:opacity protein-like surface antigen
MRKHTTMRMFGFLILPALAAAQWAPPPAGPRGGFVTTGVSYQKWSFEDVDQGLQEVCAPTTAYIPVRPDMSLTVSATPGSASWDKLKLSGLSDTWIRGTYRVPGGRYLLHAGLGLPTGKTKLKIASDSLGMEEFDLSRAIGQNIFRFRLPVFGQGLAAKVGGGAAFPVSEKVVFGAGAHYIYHGTFEPVDADSFKYQAGNEAALFGGVDVQVSPTAKWSLNLSYTFYGKDRLNDETVYASGEKLLINSSFTGRLGPGTLTAWLNWRQKGKNEFWIHTGTGTEKQTEKKNSNGPQTEVDAAWRIPFSPQGAFSVLATGRFYGQNDYRTGGADVFGGGAGVDVRMSPRLSVSLSLLGLTGKTKDWSEAAGKTLRTGLNSFDLMAGITYGW